MTDDCMDAGGRVLLGARTETTQIFVCGDPRVFTLAEAEAMKRLGLVVKGLWLVDFDTGDGYLCWKFPELHIAHYHGYQEGFGRRRPLHEVVEEFDPDWAHG